MPARPWPWWAKAAAARASRPCHHAAPAGTGPRHPRRHLLRGPRSRAARRARPGAVRGDRIAMIFQEPMSSLNPLLSIGAHVAEPLRLHRGLSRRDARARHPCSIASAFPRRRNASTTSAPHVGRHAAARDDRGGTRLRAGAADRRRADHRARRHIQAQIMDLLADSRASSAWVSCSSPTDLGVVAEQAHRVVVMYAGRLVERARTARLLPPNILFRRVCCAAWPTRMPL